MEETAQESSDQPQNESEQKKNKLFFPFNANKHIESHHIVETKSETEKSLNLWLIHGSDIRLWVWRVFLHDAKNEKKRMEKNAIKYLLSFVQLFNCAMIYLSG